MFGLSNLKLLALGSLLVPAFAASLRSGAKSIEVSDRRIVTVGGVFAAGETITGADIGTGGMIIADGDSELINEIREAWRIAEGSSSGIYYDLQQVALIVYPGQSKPWPEGANFGIYLPPLNIGGSS